MGRAKTNAKRRSGRKAVPQNVPGAKSVSGGTGRPSGLSQYGGTERPDRSTDGYGGGPPRPADTTARVWKS